MFFYLKKMFFFALRHYSWPYKTLPSCILIQLCLLDPDFLLCGVGTDYMLDSKAVKWCWKVNIKFSITRSHPVKNLLPVYHRMWGKLSTTCCNATEVAQCWASSSCWLQPRYRDGRSNWLAVTPHPTQDSTPELHILHNTNAGYKLQDLLQWAGCEHWTFWVTGQHTTCAVCPSSISSTQNMVRMHSV